MAISFKGAHFPPDIILMGVRWYVAYPLSYRHVEELIEERGVPIDHATIQRWVVKYSPLLEEAFHRRKRPVWVSWRMDETYIKVKGQWYYLYPEFDSGWYMGIDTTHFIASRYEKIPRTRIGKKGNLDTWVSTCNTLIYKALESCI